MGMIPARKAVAIPVKSGQTLTVTNTHGKQVVDFWAFDPSDTNGYLSMIHTRTILGKASLSKGDKLYSTRRKPILTLTDDTTPGVHDMLWAACDTERYRMLGYDGYHDNCTDNLHKALKENFPSIRTADDWVPDPLNLFMNVSVGSDGALEIKAPVSEKNQNSQERLSMPILSFGNEDLKVTPAAPENWTFTAGDTIIGTVLKVIFSNDPYMRYEPQPHHPHYDPTPRISPGRCAVDKQIFIPKEGLLFEGSLHIQEGAEPKSRPF
ncbi:polysaccharide deacetylase family protein [Penicillium argentinense]|uniref:Polysaccharide deacetylase family protein n=1 Tax=Penicillium argentinense TaxID=1131581 RepID=A0A9W9FF85_9EURO|nr:polysaccharide deacetylase family protein [Penicillium argentinense]KAJ5099081.1 polysaccharide deacetylase family protein [Penicillium argentinense]